MDRAKAGHSHSIGLGKPNKGICSFIKVILFYVGFQIAELREDSILR